MNEPLRPNQHPTFASPGRRVLHDLIALAGWLIFAWWWWIVFHRVSREEVLFTVLFVAFSVIIIVGITALWAWHNMEIFHRRGPRLMAREVKPDFSHDTIGRPIAFYGEGASARNAPVVHVQVEGDDKRYEPADGLPPREDSPPVADPASSGETEIQPT
jgi:hypothetical protein